MDGGARLVSLLAQASPHVAKVDHLGGLPETFVVASHRELLDVGGEGERGCPRLG